MGEGNLVGGTLCKCSCPAAGYSRARLWWLDLQRWGERKVLGSPKIEEGFISIVGSEALVVQGFPVLY